VFFTIGPRPSFDQAVADNGGLAERRAVWQTRREAEELFRREGLSDEFAVYGVKGDWDEDTVEGRDYRLTKKKLSLVQLRKENSNGRSDSRESDGAARTRPVYKAKPQPGRDAAPGRDSVERRENDDDRGAGERVGESSGEEESLAVPKLPEAAGGGKTRKVKRPPPPPPPPLLKKFGDAKFKPVFRPQPSKVDRKLFCGDCIKVMTELLPENSVDLIFADPPYAISSYRWTTPSEFSSYTSDKGDWDHYEDRDKWAAFSKAWLEAAVRVLRPGGSIFICGLWNNPSFDVYSKNEDMLFQDHIVWSKPNPAPSIHRRGPTKSVEFVLWFTKGGKWCYDYERSKEYGGGKQLKNVWNIAAVRKRHGVTRKPPELVRRIVNLFSKPGDLVLDPFVGSGTTLEVCAETKRRGIGVETNKDRCKAVVVEHPDFRLIEVPG
jgi:site-specific DNA-methyltransferase (adenine-specific)